MQASPGSGGTADPSGGELPTIARDLTILPDGAITVTFAVTVDSGLSESLTITNKAGLTSTEVVTPVVAGAVVTVDVTAEPTQTVLYVSADTPGSIGYLTYGDEDILTFDPETGAWSKFLDGSDVGLGTADLDAFLIMDNGDILLSLDRPHPVPDLGTVDDSDIVKFTPTSLGLLTTGVFTWFFDGSDVGLTQGGEDIDTIALTPNGDLLISTIGNFSVPGIGGRDEDLMLFEATSLGENTSGTWDRYFDGSDVGLRNNAEDVRGAWIDDENGDIYLTTRGNFSVPGLSGDGADIFICAPASLGVSTSCTFSLYWDGSANGFAGVVDAFDIAPVRAGVIVAGEVNADQDDVKINETSDVPEEEDPAADNTNDENDTDRDHDLDDLSTGIETETYFLPIIMKND